MFHTNGQNERSSKGESNDGGGEIITNLHLDLCQDVKNTKKVKINYRSFLKRRIFSYVIIKVTNIYGITFAKGKSLKKETCIPHNLTIQRKLRNN